MIVFNGFNRIHFISSYIKDPYASIMLSLSNHIYGIAEKLCRKYDILNRGSFKAVVEESITIGKVNPILVTKSSRSYIAFDPGEYYFILVIGFPHEYVFTVDDYWSLYKTLKYSMGADDNNIRPLYARIGVRDIVHGSEEASITLDNISGDGGLMILPIPRPHKLLDKPVMGLDNYISYIGDYGRDKSLENYIVQASYLYWSEDKYVTVSSIVIRDNDIVDAYMGIYASRELADVLMLAGPRVLELEFEDSFIREVDFTLIIDFLYSILDVLQKTRKIFP